MLSVDAPAQRLPEAVLDMGLVGLVLLVAYYVHVWNGFRALGSNAYLSPMMRGFFQGAAPRLLAFLLAGMTGGSLRPQPENALPLDRHRHDVRPAGAEAGELNAQRGDGAPGHCEARPA